MIVLSKKYLNLIYKLKSGTINENDLIHNQDPIITFKNNHMDIQGIDPTNNILDNIWGSEYFNIHSL